jgi:hypothetical protein
MAFQPLDGPAKQYSLSVGDSAVLEVVKTSESALNGRSVVTIYPIDGKIWVYFGDGINTPSASTVKSDGFPHPKTARSYEAGHLQPLFIVSDSGTVDVRIAERA